MLRQFSEISASAIGLDVCSVDIRLAVLVTSDKNVHVSVNFSTYEFSIFASCFPS